MRRRGVFSLPHAVLAVGVVAAIATMVFGATFAESASTPKSGTPGDINFYSSADDETPTSTDFDRYATLDKTFKVRFSGKDSSEQWAASGVTVGDILIHEFDGDDAALAGVGAVALSESVNSDQFSPPATIGSWYFSNNHPVMIATESDDSELYKHNFTQLPILLPAQKDGNDNGEDVSQMRKGRSYDLRAFNGGALSPSIKRTKTDSSCNSSFEAKSISDASYKWRLLEGKTVKDEHLGRSYKTSNLTCASASYTVAVEATVVKDDITSFGSDTYSLQTKSKTDGNTTNNNNSGATNNSGGTGGGSTSSSGSTSGTGSSTYKPPKYKPPKSTIPPVTPSTGSTDVDDSGLSQAVAGLRGTGTARAVSGVMLSTPATTSNPAAGGGDGKALERLAGPLASAANDVFQPINDTQDLWRFMLAVMFATGIFGGIREYRKP